MESIQKAVNVIKGGGIVVFPTDTAYGLGVDATNDQAVQKLYTLKERDSSKPIHIVVSDLEMAGEYVEVTGDAQKLADVFLPGPLTIILKDRGVISKKLLGEGSTLGIRIPDNKAILNLVESSGVPITATSANKSGDSNPYTIEDIKRSFGDDFNTIDYVIDGGELNKVPPSTLVDLTGHTLEILREGPITREEILKVIS